MINPFQAVNKLLMKEESDKMNFRDKLDMFYLDYNFTPLLVQENYLTAMDSNFRGTKKDTQRLANAAALLSLGDTFDNRMRSNNEWTLLQDIGF
jgi:replication factor C subunit 1